jgi:hypothetical protein
MCRGLFCLLNREETIVHFVNVRMNSVLFPIKQTEETMTCQDGQWSLPYSIIRRDHDMLNVRMDYVGLFCLFNREENTVHSDIKRVMVSSVCLIGKRP